MSGDTVEQQSEPEVEAAPRRQRPPDLSRLLSITAILVALAVAGSFVLDDMTRLERSARTPAASTLPSAQIPLAEPNGQRVKELEKRIALLERQIVLLQEQALSGQRITSSIQAQLSSLEAQLDQPEAETVALAELAPASEETPGDIRPAAERTDPQERPAAKQVERSDRGMPDPLPEPVIDVLANDDEPAQTASLPEPKSLPELRPILTGSLPTDTSDDIARATAVARKTNPESRAKKPAKISRTRFALALDLYDNVADVVGAWDRLHKKHGDLFSDIEPRALPQGTQDGKLKYRLMVGPIVNAASAAKRCARLSRHGIACRASVFGGQPLKRPPSPGTLIKVEVVEGANPQTPALPDHIRQILAKAPLPKPKPRLNRTSAVQ